MNCKEYKSINPIYFLKLYTEKEDRTEGERERKRQRERERLHGEIRF